MLMAGAIGVWVFGDVTGAKAATYYVSPNGDNANVGSQQSPWRTVVYAAGRTAAGDTVRVQAGTYAELLT